MNKLIISGNLGKDAIKNEVGGKTVINFSVAVKEKVKQETKTLWFDCAYWTEKTGILPYLVKGAKIIVDGRIGSRDHEGKTYFTVSVNQVELIGIKQESQSNVSARVNNEVEAVDDLPF